MDLTVLRAAAIITGIAFILVALRSLRSHSNSRAVIVTNIFVGTCIIAAGLFPSILTLPADFLSLDTVPGGRILTVLLLASALMWLRIGALANGQSRLRREVTALNHRIILDRFAREHGSTIPRDAVVVVLPCYNEAENLAKLLPAMPSHVAGRPLAVLVVDDGSHDGSTSIAIAAGALVVRHPINLGGGRALRSGFAVAHELGSDIVVTMDADGQHDPAEIPAIVAPLLTGEADIVVGSRILGRGHNASALRGWGVPLFSRLISVMSGQRITDCASGFRGMRVSALARLQLVQEQYHTTELIIEACKSGARIVEAPITIRAREHGMSKKGHDVFYGYNFAKAIAKSWLR